MVVDSEKRIRRKHFFKVVQRLGTSKVRSISKMQVANGTIADNVCNIAYCNFLGFLPGFQNYCIACCHLFAKIIKKPRHGNRSGEKCNTYEKILFYSSSFWLSSYSLRRRFWTSVGTCWYSAYFMVKVPRPEVSELSEVE